MMRFTVGSLLLVATAMSFMVSCKPSTSTDSTPAPRVKIKPIGGSRSAKETAASTGILNPEAEDQSLLIARGAESYKKGLCSKCHRPDATGGPRAPDLTDSQWLHCDGTVEGIEKVLIDGVPKNRVKDSKRLSGMNSAKRLVPNPDDLHALAVYVHSLSQADDSGSS